MRTPFRNLLAWTLALSLLGGAWLPLVSLARIIDSDGLCGPPLVLENADAEVSVAPVQAPGAGGHCTFCHWLHAMAGASASATAVIGASIDRAPRLTDPAAHHPAGVVSGVVAPRGPPAVS
jgi:hypothetical protein